MKHPLFMDSLTQAGMESDGTFHEAETAKRITDRNHFTWTHLVEAKDMKTIALRVASQCFFTYKAMLLWLKSIALYPYKALLHDA